MLHGTVGGISSVLQGGKFGHGFLSAGLAKAINVNEIFGTAPELAGVRIIAAAVIGGTISEISGGKFGNGAVTAAFAQMFNGENEAKIEEMTAEIKEEIYNDAAERFEELRELRKEGKYDEIRELYPHLAHWSDKNLKMESNILQLQFYRMYLLTANGRVSNQLEQKIIKPAKFALELAIDKTPRGIGMAFIDLFYSSAPPIKHQFIYNKKGLDVEFVRRQE